MATGRLSGLAVPLLAVVFTIGLTFASLELPYLADRVLLDNVHTPAIQSRTDEIAALETELFIAHYHLRTLGYAAFIATLALIVAGYAGLRPGLAAWGAGAVMLQVFAQFAGVMFFLAGLGLLNAMWLPVLDVSWDLHALGGIVLEPLRLWRKLPPPLGGIDLRRLAGGVIALGLLVFLLGTHAWLNARRTGPAVATARIYRLSRHPQYLGWIVWTYGMLLLQQLMRYPKRSWGLSGSLPWLVSTLVIIGVALIEELRMEREHGARYAEFRARTPFLLPLPRFVTAALAWPLWLFFRRGRPRRAGEVAVFVTAHLLVLVAASAVCCEPGWRRLAFPLRPEQSQQAELQRLGDRISMTPDHRARYRWIEELSGYGERALPQLLSLLRDSQPEVRNDVAACLARRPRPGAAAGLVDALGDPDANVRNWALGALGNIGDRAHADAIVPLLDDPDPGVRWSAMAQLARLGDARAAQAARPGLATGRTWDRRRALWALGLVGDAEDVPALASALEDSEPMLRRVAVLALLNLGDPAARPALEQARRDEDREVRLYAAEALKRLPRP